MSKIKLLLLSVVAVCILFIIIVSLPTLVLYLSIKVSPSPPEPEIKQGEFPFSLTYSINGSTVVVEDTLLCQYSGIKFDTSVGKYRSWTSRLLSGNEYIIMYKTQGIPESSSWSGGEDSEKFYTIIYFDPGNAGYYMGDRKSQDSSFPNARFVSTEEGESRIIGNVKADDLLQNYGIKLIKWEASPPIINKFVEN